MSVRRLVRDAERALARDPQSRALKLKLAAALRSAGRHHDAIDTYRSVAVAYQKEGRLLQALAVCRSLLEIAPEDLETLVLMGEIEAARTGGAPGEEPTRFPDGPRARMAEVVVGPDEYDYDPDDLETPPGGEEPRRRR